MAPSRHTPTRRSRRRRPAPPIRVFHAYRGLRAPHAALREAGRRIYADQRLPAARQTHVVLCSDHVIRRLNRTFRGIDRATDVLAFNYDDPDLLGEVYISLQRAAVQARRLGHGYTAEVRRLFVHGVLHLLGCDHESARERAAMEAEEARYSDV